MPQSDDLEEDYSSDRFWNYHPRIPLELAPYFDTPWRIWPALRYWLKTWSPFGTQFIFLCIAIIVWLFFTPLLERVTAFKFDWMVEIWLRDMMLTLSVVGGLHLYLHTLAKQGMPSSMTNAP